MLLVLQVLLTAGATGAGTGTLLNSTRDENFKRFHTSCFVVVLCVGMFLDAVECF